MFSIALSHLKPATTSSSSAVTTVSPKTELEPMLLGPWVPMPYAKAGKDYSWLRNAVLMIDNAGSHCTPKLLKAFSQLISQHKDSINDAVLVCKSTIFHHLAKSKNPVQFVDVLVRNGIDFSIQERGPYYNTPLMWAIADGQNEMAKEILSRMPRSQAASLYLQGYKGNTILHLIVGKGYTTQTKDGESVSCTNAELLALAVRRGADVNLANEKGNTPLHLAYARRDHAMVKFLIAHGADQTAVNKEGVTPKDMLYLGSTPKESYSNAKKILDESVEVYLLNEAAYNNSENLKELDLLTKNSAFLS